MIRYLTAKEIQMLYGRPIGTIHRLASTEGWKKSNDDHRPVLYNAEDVRVTMKRLKEARRLDADLHRR